MALIKKHNAGGKADFKQHVAERLLTDESLSAREQELISQGLDTFDTENLGEDSEDKRSFFGKVRDENTAKTWLKDEYKTHSEKNTTEKDISPEGGWKHERDIGDIFDHIIKEDYGGNEDSAFRSLGEMTDNNKIKQYAIKKAKDLVGSYVSRAHQESIDSPNNVWHKKEEAEALQHVLFGIDENKEINDDDWNKVLDFSNKLGWNLGDMTRTPQELEDIEKLKKEKERKGFLEKSEKQLKGLDLDEETVLQLSGYTLADDDYEPLEDMPFLQDLLKKDGYSLIQSEDKKTHALVKDGKIVTDAGGLISDDQLNDHFGKTWGVSGGAFTIFDKDQMEANTAFDKSKIGEDKFNRNIGRQILTTDPDFEGYEIIGYSGDDYRGGYDVDELGRRRFTKEFKFIKDGKEFKVIRGEDGVYRKDGETKEFKMPKGLSYGKEVTNEIKDYNKMYFKHAGNPVSQLYGKKISREGKKLGLEKAESELMRFEKEYKDAVGQEREVNIKSDHAKHVGEFLKHVMTTDTYTQAQKDQAEKLLQRLSKFSTNTVFKNGQEVMLFDTDLFKWREGGVIEKIEEKEEIPFDMIKFEKWKNGGVIKSASGGSTQDYLARVSKLAEGRESLPDDDTGTPHSTGYHDPTGTVADANLLDWISTGASVASFIPGIGIAGGVVSTVADAANAMQRGWTKGDTMNLLSNIGFTALAGIGLGAAKGVKMAGKAGKVASKVSKVGKAGKQLKTVGTTSRVARSASIASSRAARMGDAGTDVAKAADKIKKLAGGVDSKTMTELLSGKASKGALDIAKKFGYEGASAIASDMKLVNQLSKAKLTLAGQAGEGAVKIGKQIVGTAPGLVGKGVKYGLGAVQVGGGLKGAFDIAGNVAEEGNLIRGLQKSQMSDVRNVLQTTALGYGYNQNRLGKRALDNNTKVIYGKDPTNTLSVDTADGVKQFSLSGKPGTSKIKPTVKGRFFTRGKNKVDGTNYTKKDLDAFKSEIKGLVSEGEYNTIVDALNKGATASVSSTAGTISQRVLLDKPLGTDSKSIREYLRAKKILETGNANYFSPRNSRWSDRGNAMTESEYNTSVGKIAPGKMKLLPAGTPRPSTVTKTKSGDVIRTPHTAYSKQPDKVSTASAGTNTKSGSVIITPYTAKQPNKAGVQKPKVSAKAKPTKVTPRHRTTKKYKEGSKEVRAKMDKAAREQAKNSKKWLKEFYAKKRAKRSKLEQGGILKHNLGGKHSWLNNDWMDNPFAPQVSTQENPIYREETPVTTSTTPATTPTSSTYIPRIGGPRWTMYGRGLRRPNEYRIGDPLNFDPSYKGYLERQRRQRQTTESGLYLGQQDPEYPLYNSSSYGGNPLNNETGGSTGGSSDDFKWTVRQYDHIPFDRKPIRNYGPGLEWLRKTISNRANMESTILAQKAASKYGTQSGIESQHIRTGTPYESFALDQAGKMRGLGRRLATASADIDKGNLARLDAESRAQGTILQGRMGDIQRNDQIRSQRQQMDARTNEYNTRVADFNRDAGARSEGAQLQLSAKERLQRGLNDGAWIQGITRELADKPRKDLFNRYITEMQDPNIAGRQQYYQEMTSAETLAERKRMWDKEQKSLWDANNSHRIVPFEESEGYVNYMKEVNRQARPMQQKMNMLTNIGNLLAVYGGSKK